MSSDAPKIGATAPKLGTNIIQGDVIEVLKDYPDESFTACFCDPPYGLKFMGREWDHGVPATPYWAEILRVLKPGAVLMAFGGTRTWHRLAVAIEDAGFELFDTAMWLHAQGFPKSHSIGKALDRARGAERKVIGEHPTTRGRLSSKHVESQSLGAGWYGQVGEGGKLLVTGPATDAAKIWEGYGTALKPSVEPILCARKPLTRVPLHGILAETNLMLGGMTWVLLSSVNDVARVLQSSPVGPGEVSVSVATLVGLLHGVKSGDLSAKTDTFNSPETVSMCLNIARLWNSILAASWNGGSTFTTRMANELITALRILNSLLLPNMPAEVTEGVCPASGQQSSADIVANDSSDGDPKSSDTQKHIVIEPATWQPGVNGICVQNAANALRLIIPSVVSALSLALTGITTESDASTFVPNWEPILCARKPRIATYAKTVMEHGTAALNIDGCRIASAKPYTINTWDDGAKPFGDGAGHPFTGRQQSGRWPANLLLSHLPECVRVGVRRIKTAPGGSSKRNSKLSEEYWGQGGGGFKVGRSTVSHADPDGLETVDKWECAEDCPVAMLDRQSGVSSSKASGYNWESSRNDNPTRIAHNIKSGVHFGDAGGASRFFKTFEGERFCYCSKANKRERNMGLPEGEHNNHTTVKPLALCKYLARLIVPPEEYRDEAELLVPFAGVMSEAIGALLAGWRNITAIELEKEYCGIGQKRIDWWVAKMRDIGLTDPKTILKTCRKEKI